MTDMTQQDILDAIRRTTKKNGNIPLGVRRFEKETGINPYDWGKYWARFGDAQKEAGYRPNQLQGVYGNQFLIEKIIFLMRKLAKFPTYREIEVENRGTAEFPSKRVFYRLGTKAQLAAKVLDYCKEKDDYGDIVELCEPILERSDERANAEALGTNIGEVYLFRSGRYYKIGKTNEHSASRKGASNTVARKMHFDPLNQDR